MPQDLQLHKERSRNMARSKAKRPQPTVESASEGSEKSNSSPPSKVSYEVRKSLPPRKPQQNTRPVPRSTGRGTPIPARRPQRPSAEAQISSAQREPIADSLAASALGIGRQSFTSQLGQGTPPRAESGQLSRRTRQGDAGTAASAAAGQTGSATSAGAGDQSKSAASTAAGQTGSATSAAGGQTGDQTGSAASTTAGDKTKSASTQATPAKRRGDPGIGPSATKKRISPKKTTTMIIPGSQLPNGGKHALPKGTVMEMIQVRDLEVSRLMEELQNYEDEAMVLTHQIHVMENEKHELEMQIQEMAKDMANMQRATSLMRLSSAIGPRLTYWPDDKILFCWDRLVTNVLSFSEDHCSWATEGGIDGMGQYRPDPWNLGGSAEAGHFRTFENLMGEQDPKRLETVRITQSYVRKLTSDGLGNSYPSRLDAFVGEGRPNELIPAAMIMKILQSEVFDKIRWLLRSEPFWDPMKNPTLTPDVDWQTFKGRMTNDFLVQQERFSARDDPSESNLKHGIQVD